MTTATFDIRQAGSDDAPELIGLRLKFFESQIAAGLLDIPESLEKAVTGTTPSIILNKRTQCLVAAASGRLLGYVTLLTRVVPGVTKPMVASIEESYVLDEMRGSGLASQLLEEAISRIKGAGIDRLQLRVLAENDRGKAFWAKNGFVDNVHIMEYTRGLE
jgi:ribosomal protein S18 acetylase RimI-like enzyme